MIKTYELSFFSTWIFSLIWSWPIPTHHTALPYHMTATNQGGKQLSRASSKMREASRLYLFEQLLMHFSLHIRPRHNE